MLTEAAQVAQEAVKQGSYIQVAIPTAAVSSFLTVLSMKGLELLIGKRRSKNGHVPGPKPGEAEVCRIRGERMATAEAKIEGVEDTLKRHDGYFQEILRRLPK